MAFLQATHGDPNRPQLNEAEDDAGIPSKQNIFQRIGKNFRQFSNILPGILVLIVAGCQIVWEVSEMLIEQKYRINFIGNLYSGKALEYEYHIILIPSITTHNVTEAFAPGYYGFLPIALFWYIAIAIGAVIGALLHKNWNVKKIYFANGILLLVCGFLYFITASYFIVLGIYIGRLLSGIIYGLNYVTVIMHAADNSAREIRGTVLRCVAYGQVLTILWAFTAFKVETSTEYTYIQIGINYGFTAILVLISTHFCVYNSFVQSVDKLLNEEDIYNDMLKIRHDQAQVGQTRHALREIKVLLNDNQTIGSGIFAEGNWTPLSLAIVARCLSVCINNVPLLLLIAEWVNALGYLQGLGAPSGTFIVIFVFKFLIGWIAMFLADFIGFNRFFYIAAMIWAPTVILAYILPREIIYFIVLSGYYIIALGIDAISYNQLSEAFSLPKRAWSIAFVTFVETIFQISIVAFSILLLQGMLAFLLIIIIISLCAFLLKMMPNTHGESLRNARDLFNKSLARASQRANYEMANVSYK